MFNLLILCILDFNAVIRIQFSTGSEPGGKILVHVELPA